MWLTRMTVRALLLVQTIQLQRSGPELPYISSGHAGGHLLHRPCPADGIWPQEVQAILIWGMSAWLLDPVCGRYMQPMSLIGLICSASSLKVSAVRAIPTHLHMPPAYLQSYSAPQQQRIASAGQALPHCTMLHAHRGKTSNTSHVQVIHRAGPAAHD